jgi:alanine dehydrogenase
MVRVLSDADVDRVLSLPDLVPVVESAFVSQGAGAVERPERPHFPVGIDRDPGETETDVSAGEPAGTALTMPAYIHGMDTFATKLVTVHEGNSGRGLPTVNAQIAVTDAETGQPLAYLDGTRVTNARTACIGAIAARELSSGPITLGLLGAGTQARWQARAIAATVPVESVAVYSPNTREACAAALDEELDADVTAVPSPAAAAANDVVVTATTSTEPVFDASDLQPGAVLVAVGAYTAEMQEVDPAAFERAARVFADVPEEVLETGDLRATDLTVDDLVPFAEVCGGRAGRETAGEVVVESVGSAVLDAAAADHVYQRAVDRDVGTAVDL